MLPQPWGPGYFRGSWTGYNGLAESAFIGGRSHMTTGSQAAARRVTYQLETLWDYNCEPTHQELETLYETAKKNQWNGSTAIRLGPSCGDRGTGPQRPGRLLRNQFLQPAHLRAAEGGRDPRLGLAPEPVPPRRAGRAGGMRSARQLDPRARREALRVHPGRG